MPKFELLVVFLTTESSYKANIERPHRGVPDTVQYWHSPQSDWRIRTFATDHDIHVFQLRDGAAERKFDLNAALNHTLTHYDGIVDRFIVLKFNNPADTAEVAQVLAFHKLTGEIEQNSSRLAFYNLDIGRYWTQSEPK